MKSGTKTNLSPPSNVNKKCKASHLSLNNIWIIPYNVVSITSWLLFLAHVRIVLESCLNQVKAKLVIIALAIATLFSIFEGMSSSSVFQIFSLIKSVQLGFKVFYQLTSISLNFFLLSPNVTRAPIHKKHLSIFFQIRSERK